MLGFSDDILEGLVGALLDPKQHEHPNPVALEQQLEGFLAGKTRQFVTELMRLMQEANDNPSGVPVSVMSGTTGGALAEASHGQAAVVLEAVERLRAQGVGKPSTPAAPPVEAHLIASTASSAPAAHETEATGAPAPGRRKRRWGAEPQLPVAAAPTGGASTGPGTTTTSSSSGTLATAGAQPSLPAASAA